MNDLLAKTFRNNIYNSLDLKSAYLQVTIKIKDKPFTAFESVESHLKLLTIVHFQSTIDNIIKRNNFNGVNAYVDKIVVVGKTQQVQENFSQF